MIFRETDEKSKKTRFSLDFSKSRNILLLFRLGNIDYGRKRPEF